MIPDDLAYLSILKLHKYTKTCFHMEGTKIYYIGLISNNKMRQASEPAKHFRK